MSVLKTFRNFKVAMFVAFLLLSILTYSILNSNEEIKKIALLQVINKQSQETLKFDIFGGKTSIQLLKEHQYYMNLNFDKLQDFQNEDYVTRFYIPSSQTDTSLKSYTQIITSLHKSTLNYYKTEDEKYLPEIKVKQKKLLLISDLLQTSIINDLSFKNKLTLYIALVNIINIALIFLWYTRKLTIIYRDIKQILNVEEDDRKKNYNTSEFIAIKRRMERRPLAGGGKNLLDPLTELLNEKGLVNEYVQRNSGGSKEFVCVTIFDIDNFKELSQNHGKAFTDTVNKKIAFIMNLEKKPADILGRIGEDQFIMITPRADQAQAFSTVDTIRQSIEKVNFKTSSGKITVTVSGGFTPKDKHEKIESAISTANTLVKRAKIQGKNSIAKQQGFNEEKNLRM